MSNSNPPVGSIGWRDLTVPNATEIRDFYQSVIGWQHQDVDMGGYSDFAISPVGSDDAIAGICHARGANADVPPQWLVYFTVANVADSAERTEKLGGKVLVAPRGLMGGTFCVVQDPAGAVCALYEPPAG